jgi:alpha-glucosidase
MALGNVTGVTTEGDTLAISIGSDQLIVQQCKPEILKVDYLPSGAGDSDTQVIDPNKTWSDGNTISISTATDPMVITTSRMIIKISKTPCRISVYDTANNLLLNEQSTEGVYSDGVKFNHSTSDNFYGIGEDGNVLKNSGGSVYAGNQGHSGAPFVWSNKGYGVLVDSDGGSFSISSSTLQYSSVSKTDIEYYIIVGKPVEILTGVAEISGKAPMFPKWAMGFTNTEWGITESELKSIVDTYRSKQIPIDNYCLDFDWKNWGQDNYGDFTWNGTNFPDAPSGTLESQMAVKGIKLTGILKPRVHVNTVQGQEVSTNGWWLPGSSSFTDYCSGKTVNNLDFSKAALRTWFFNHLKDSFDKGIIGWWNDEADVGFDNWGHFNMEKGMYEGQRAYKNQRVWSISRNFYLGAQRYAYGMWTGDINTGFDSMADQRRRMIGSINLGLAKWGMDTGGFNDDPSSENYARWIEFSAFTPIFRVHGHLNAERQPWVYGTNAEAAAKKVMQLRYQLIPYIYAYERQAYEMGVGLVKPLMVEYPDDSNVADYTNAWMFGDYLLVSPVVTQGQTSKNIYLPAGTWIDFFKGTTYTGRKTISYVVNSSTWDDVPLFIKKGAIIPSQDFVNYVGEKAITTVYVDVFPDTAQTSFKYYDDDGITYDYEKGVYFAQTITAQANVNSATVTIGSNDGTYTPEIKYYLVKLHFEGAATVTIDGNPVTQYSSYSALQSAAGEGWAMGTDIYGAVIYAKVAAGIPKSIIAAVKKDVDPPTAPSNLQSAKQTGNTISLSWTASTDDVAVVGYQIFRDGEDITPNLVKETAYTDVGLTTETSYNYYVIAKDAVGNSSLKSNEISVMTQAESNRATVYYQRGFSVPYFHYKKADGTWTTVPGIAMADAAPNYPRYSVIKDVEMGTATQLEACFNDGNGNWDSKNGANYFFPVGTSTFNSGTITAGAPPTGTIPVTFTVNNATTQWGQNVYIIGSIDELSNWTPSTAIGPASCPNYPTWTITINLPAGQVIEFKAIKKDGSGNIIWEGGSNHTYTVPASGNGNISISWQN